MLSLKAHFGRFYLFVVFACLSTESLLAIDSSSAHSYDNEKKDFMHKYNEYAYLDDEPLDIDLEIAACEPPKKNLCEPSTDKSQVHHCECRVCKPQVDCHQCRGCKSQCFESNKSQKYFSVYDAGKTVCDVGKTIAVIYVVYKTRNIIKVAFISMAWAINTLNFCFGKIVCED